jgi:HD-GYP domain-containing protein (c-di-GMP phosphodiesterase class II)
MMRVPAKARVLFTATVLLGLGMLVGAVAFVDSLSLPAFALLAAAVILTELLQVTSADGSEDPEHAHAFSFSSSVHLGAVLIAGPLAAAVVAALGVVAVDGLRGQRASKVLFNASVFALASATGGMAYLAAGGESGVLDLPGDFVAVAILAVVYSGINVALVTMIISLTASNGAWRTLHRSFWSALPSTASEAGLGMLFALCAFVEPWAVAALVPLVLSVYLAHARLALLRRETSRALETFANMVDERDPYTYRHSTRVAEYVHELALGLRLAPAEVARLHRAGRLHDLGKISVDAAVLRKSSRLDAEEWAAMRRHPRLSARLLRRFHFAAEEARAVEYHHERFDGRGYYGIESGDIPLTAHFLIVADSYDAMTSDRPYRRGLSEEAALTEIEQNAGTQFHPAVAKAFVAQRRGLDPIAAISATEYEELRRVTIARRSSRLPRLPWELFAALALAVGFGLTGLGHPEGAVAGALVAAGAVIVHRRQLRRGERLARALRAALEETSSAAGSLRQLHERLSSTAPLRWSGVLDWQERQLSGSIVIASGPASESPEETALTSWLVREADASAELLHDRQGSRKLVGVRLERDGSTAGYVVLVFESLPRHVELALRALHQDLSVALAPLCVDAPTGVLAAAS